MKNLLTILVAIYLTSNIIAQSPEKMKYQAVIRDNNGHVVTNQAIGMKISILQGDLPGTVVYTETQSLLSNAQGLTSTEIGTGSVVLGDFSTIDWANGPYFLQIETDPTGGTNYTVTGTNQLLSVPYAMHAESAMHAKIADSLSFIFITTGFSNTALGYYALSDNNTGHSNTAIGKSTLSNNTTGHQNTAMGHDALRYNTTGYWNTAIGKQALEENTTGYKNIAIGQLALANNTIGNENMAIGINTLRSNTTGSENTALGNASMINNTTGVSNTAHGYNTLLSNTTGNHNTAVGKNALDNNFDGQRNTSLGSGALQSNSSGDDNTAIGFTALSENLFGDNNTAVGRTALFSNNFGNENTAIGRSALYFNTSGEQNTGLGRNALVNVTTGDNNTGIGYDAQVPTATGSDQVRIGNTAISYAGIQVSWSITSDKIWKEHIRELPYGLDMLMQLKPVDYMRKNNDVKTREMGFIAQDVEATLKEMGYDNQGFLTKDDQGQLSLRYNDFIALLTKGMQEQQQLIESLIIQNKQMKDDLAKINSLLEINALK